MTVGGQTYNFVTALSTNAGGTANEVVAGDFGRYRLDQSRRMQSTTTAPAKDNYL